MARNGASSIDRPTSDQIERALARIAASETLRASPQLVAFLRYVVTTTLAGQADRIKGYTIAVEALGRDADFDPQSDPIVRVEASRLRRALDRYYAEEGADEKLVITLPLGSYVPAFQAPGGDPGTPDPSGRSDPPAPAPTQAHPGWRFRPATVAAMVLIAGIAGAAFGLRQAGSVPPAEPAPRAAPAVRLTGSPMPIVVVRPFDEIGPTRNTETLDLLRRKLREALARFDEIELAIDSTESDAAARGPRRLYRLVATAETGADGTLRLFFRLQDAADRVVVWARSYALHPENAANPDDIVGHVAATVASPYGVVYARELTRRGNADIDPRYGCLLDAMEYRRSYDVREPTELRACLQDAIARDPFFGGGFAALAMVANRDYRFRDGGREALARGLRAAKRAVEIAPQSARAHQAMMTNLYARGMIAPALAQGEKAFVLNPYDLVVLSSYGMRLVASGQIDKGTALLRQAAEFAPVGPAMLPFAMFLGAYLRDDDASAAYHASLLTSETYAFGLLARALVAAKAGDRDQARRLVEALSRLSPLWSTNPRAAIGRYIPDPAIIERLADDLARSVASQGH